MSGEPSDWDDFDQQGMMQHFEHRFQAALAVLKASMNQNPTRTFEQHALIAAAGSNALMKALRENDG